MVLNRTHNLSKIDLDPYEEDTHQQQHEGGDPLVKAELHLASGKTRCTGYHLDKPVCIEVKLIAGFWSWSLFETWSWSRSWQ